MADKEQAEVLTGLVSPEAAELYERLQAVGGLPVGAGRGRLDLEAAVGRELRESGVVFMQGAGEERVVRAVHPQVALRRLLDRQHRHLSSLQKDLAVTWERFASMTSPSGGPAEGAPDAGEVRIVRDHAEMVQLAAGLYRSPRRLLRATFNGRLGAKPTTEGVLLPPKDSVAAGAEFRMLYDAEHASGEWGAHSVRQSVLAGEQARVRQTVPLRMMHVDDMVALVTVDRDGTQGALHVHSPPLLRLLAEWFDALWDAPGSTVVGGPGPVDLTPVRRKVLCLMAAGLTDDAIANQTGTGVRTIRRHISAILEILGVEGRFAAGVAAVKRGWL
ncbi:helix-turn-helix transcriptional regulator [Amycolatopsis sp. H20-H5]|uniref:helix-turn-helix transcriptional regulator n=1 Tax=Amycolatopsis sp. H20-H5 TaxID=3046309 RepID=UPI002DBE1DB3|nr:helix-turn-helix transcriptional regulator [Amycolatopsis sp. H20-H5]MEC3973867.1 helix-turn-helix transcriptional regulator [Amycolatopsis sp. H20-H5]